MSIRLLIEQMADFWQQQSTAVTGLNVDALLSLAPRTNLFTSLSVPVVGVPALMVGLTPEKTPLSTTLIELDSAVLVLALFVLFSVLGLLLTAVYMTLTASVVRQTPVRQALGTLLINWLRLVGLIVTLLIFAMMVYIPVVIVGVLAALISQGLASLVLLAGPLLILWVAVYMIFAPHGIFVNGRPLGRAMIESLQMMRSFMLSAMTLLLFVILIGRGVDMLLLYADDGSWLTGFGILGHAFVNTALLAATFIFYRDRYNVLFGVKRPLFAEPGSVGENGNVL
ncbi:MAG: hypothetical protein H6667_15180 [Ardenticatenaceae bacterium]|nr:hypothetical protein [Ardenticatenaceae bacterium]